jgi:hypothetical protein
LLSLVIEASGTAPHATASGDNWVVGWHDDMLCHVKLTSMFAPSKMEPSTTRTTMK